MLVFLSLSSFPQTYLTFSPYSRYGIGEIAPQGFAHTRAMGGLSQGVRSGVGINYSNPASYSAQDTLSFIFDFALEANGVNYQQGENSNLHNMGNIHHLAIQFPVTKWWGASLGFQPYSNVGYRLRYTQMDPELLSSIGTIKHQHSGKGGITQLYLGNAIQPFKNLSVGANISYLFGSVEHHTDIIFPAGTNYFDTYKLNSMIVRDLVYSVGAQYSIFLGSQRQVEVVLGGTLDAGAKVNSQYTNLSTLIIGNTIDTISYTEDADGTFLLPPKLSAGLTIAYGDKFLGGVEFSTQDWTSTTFAHSPNVLTNSQTLRAGFEFTPNRLDLRSYLKRISYRAGIRYSDTYLKFGDRQITDAAITLGLGLPLRRTRSSLNFSIEVGQRGTLLDNLVKETYGTFNIGITFYDFWFYKRQYN